MSGREAGIRSGGHLIDICGAVQPRRYRAGQTFGRAYDRSQGLDRNGSFEFETIPLTIIGFILTAAGIILHPIEDLAPQPELRACA
jgi:hypothetical protein